MIYKELSFYDFKDEFKKFGRENQFSNWGLKALFDYLDDTGLDVELDVIALCCEYSDYDIEELKGDFKHVLLEYFNLEELEEASFRDLIEVLDDELDIVRMDLANEMVLIAN